MDILVFKPHSTVDLITNSSSELFVFNENVTTARIHEIVDLLSRAFEDVRTMPAFRDMFDEPMVVTKGFRDVLEECPIKLPPKPESEYGVRGISDEQRAYWEKSYQIHDWIIEHYPEYDGVVGYEDYYGGIYDIEEGDIFLYSATNNSVPWAIMEALEKIAKERIHLG